MPQFNDQIPFPVKDPSAEILADTLIEIGRRVIKWQDDLDFAQIREDQLKADLKRYDDNYHRQASSVKTLEERSSKLALELEEQKETSERLHKNLLDVKEELRKSDAGYLSLMDKYNDTVKKCRRLERQVKKLTRKK